MNRPLLMDFQVAWRAIGVAVRQADCPFVNGRVGFLQREAKKDAN
jgi:hypothetical protein